VAITKEYDPERDGPKRPRPPMPITKEYDPERDGPKRPRPPMPGRPFLQKPNAETARGNAIMKRLNK
jgi:hypothetical protein